MSAIQGLQSPTTYREAAAAQLRSVIGRRGTTARQLAFAIGKDPSFVTKRTRGQVAIDTDDIDTFARALGVTPRELIPDWPPASWSPDPGPGGIDPATGSQRTRPDTPDYRPVALAA